MLAHTPESVPAADLGVGQTRLPPIGEARTEVNLHDSPRVLALEC